MLNTRLGKDIKRNDNEQKEIGEREPTSTTCRDNQYRDVNIFQRRRIQVRGSLELERKRGMPIM
jgi:hypothetical protein